MRKVFLFGIIAGIVILLVLIVRLLLEPAPSAPTPSVYEDVTPVFPIGEDIPPLTVAGDRYEVPTRVGTLSTPNFLKMADVIPDPMNPGFYNFADSTDSDFYSIQYIAQTGHFTIALTAFPLAEARLRAESDLRARLELTDEQMCSLLRYTVAVPAFVDVEASGVDYRFSFCPDAVPL